MITSQTSIQDGISDASGSNTGTSQPIYNEEGLNMLEAMGFPLLWCQKALLATGNDGQAAMEWLLAHMEDPGN